MEPSVIDLQRLAEAQTWRPTEETARMLDELSSRTRMPKAEIIRRAVAMVLPKFLSGEWLLVDATQPSAASREVTP